MMYGYTTVYCWVAANVPFVRLNVTSKKLTSFRLAFSC